jgi:phosphatidylglycerophosphatase C
VPASRTTPPGVVAAFDVDGTLTTRDCVTPFLWRVAGFRLVLALARHPLAVAVALVRRDNDRLKGLACSALRGVDASDLQQRGELYAREIHDTMLRPDTSARLHAHRQRGHAVVLASASLEAYLAPLGRLLETDGVVCTQLETGPDGRLTGRLHGANCRGPEKARRLRSWLETKGLAEAELWAYGDSNGDVELLELADHAVWVRGVQVAPLERAD